MDLKTQENLRLAAVQKELQAGFTEFQNITKQPTGSSEELYKVLKVIERVEESTGALYNLRRSRPVHDPVRQSIEHLIAMSARVFLTFQSKKKVRELSFREKYFYLWTNHFSLFLYTLSLFIVGSLVGWNLGVYGGEYATALLSQGLVEDIVNHNSWFSRIRENPIGHGFSIALNNVKVAITAYISGSVLGFGSMYILLYNALFFGSVMGFCYVNGFNESLTNFVLGHGPLELTIIIAAAFAGFIFARQFYQFGPGFNQRLARSAKNSGFIMAGVIPWLVIAACIEVFVSPFDYLNSTQKMVFGILITIFFWLWTFTPAKPSNR